MMSYTQPGQYYIKHILIELSSVGHFAVQNIETWQTDSSTGNTPMAIKNFPL